MQPKSHCVAWFLFPFHRIRPIWCGVHQFSLQRIYVKRMRQNCLKHLILNYLEDIYWIDWCRLSALFVARLRAFAWAACVFAKLFLTAVATVSAQKHQLFLTQHCWPRRYNSPDSVLVPRHTTQKNVQVEKRKTIPLHVIITKSHGWLNDDEKNQSIEINLGYYAWRDAVMTWVAQKPRESPHNNHCATGYEINERTRAIHLTAFWLVVRWC